MMAQSPQVYFIGAGPGAPDLITLRGQQIIARADCVLYADSLVMPDVTRWAKPGAEVIPTAELNLDQILALIIAAVERGQVVARLHSGDPTLYGAVHEQLAALNERGITTEIVPGVSAVFAAAAALGAELTVPGLTQTVICTRISGRASPVPERESLRSLAAHGASLAVFLSVTKSRQVQDDLLTGYPPDTPVAILYRISWPDEKILRCRLSELAETVRAAGLTRQTLILISPALAAPAAAPSKLYASDFQHRFRVQTSEVKHWTQPSAGHPTRRDARSAVLSITRAGTELARRLSETLGGVAYGPQHFTPARETGYQDSVINAARRAWAQHQALIFVAPVSIAVRAIGPLARDKHTDPAVVALDELGHFVVSVLSGHLGGANDLARRIAQFTGGQAVITTASDAQETVALDLLAERARWSCEAGSALTKVGAAIVNGDPVRVYVQPGCDDAPLREAVWPGLIWVDSLDQLNGHPAIVLTDRQAARVDSSYMVLFHPRSLALGIGCQRGVSDEAIEVAVRHSLEAAGLAFDSIACLATVRAKAEEPGLLAFAERFGLPVKIYEDGEIIAIAQRVLLNHSAAMEKLGLPGVSEPCALLAARATALLATKRAEQGVTVAVARMSP